MGIRHRAGIYVHVLESHRHVRHGVERLNRQEIVSFERLDWMCIITTILKYDCQIIMMVMMIDIVVSCRSSSDLVYNLHVPVQDRFISLYNDILFNIDLIIIKRHQASS